MVSVGACKTQTWNVRLSHLEALIPTPLGSPIVRRNLISLCALFVLLAQLRF